MTSETRHNRPMNGFTLVEMLVALGIFAAIASIGVGLLRASVNTQDAVQERLGAMGAVNRLRAIMAQDLTQAVLRPTRDVGGNVQPAFVGSATSFSLVHRGRTGDAVVPAVQRVAYRLEGDEWQRAATAAPDGAAPPQGDALARSVSRVALRYRDARGEWRESWSSEIERVLPTAVELRLTRQDRTPLLLRFATAPTLLPPPSPGSAP